MNNIYPIEISSQIYKNITILEGQFKNRKNIDPVQYKKISDEYTNIYNIIRSEYYNLRSNLDITHREIESTRGITTEYKKIIYNFKYNKQISAQQFDIVSDLLDEYNFSPLDQISIFKKIDDGIVSKKFDSTMVTEILTTNYEKYLVDNYENADIKAKYSKIIDTYYMSLKDCEDKNSLITFLNTLEGFENDEYYFIMESIINKYITSLEEIKKDMYENYKDEDLREVIFLDYSQQFDNYKTIDSVYKKRKELINAQELAEMAKYKENEVYYLLNNDLPYLTNDMKYVSEEYYGKIKKLIDALKDNKLAPDQTKNFTTINKKINGFKELREDQVRIMYKKIEDNKYMILGAFTKKRDNDVAGCKNIIDRYEKNKTEEIMKKNEIYKIDDLVYDYIENNKRVGNR